MLLAKRPSTAVLVALGNAFDQLLTILLMRAPLGITLLNVILPRPI